MFIIYLLLIYGFKCVQCRKNQLRYFKHFEIRAFYTLANERKI